MSTQRVAFTKEDIGPEILPILTTGLYHDTLDALREYIQNAIDAKSTQITIVINPHMVTISDDGLGMDEKQAARAKRLGISDKNPVETVGFRGIGIYSGFNTCDLLEVYTKSASDSTSYKITFNFRKIRVDLLAEQEKRKSGKPPELYLEALLENSVFVDVDEKRIVKEHGTQVRLIGLLPDAYTRLNDWDDVSEYLQNVVPLPFSETFRYGKEIEDHYRENDLNIVPLTLQIGSRREDLVRPYEDDIFTKGGQHKPAYFPVKSRAGQEFGFAWVCVNDARSVIKSTEVRGLLIKKSGFSIGDRKYLEPYFVRTVYSRRITGELVVQNDNLIPNAARSDFEHNSTRHTFIQTLATLTQDVTQWANQIQERERAGEIMDEVSQELARMNADLLSQQRNREELLRRNAVLANMDRMLKPYKSKLKNLFPDEWLRVSKLLEETKAFVKNNLVSGLRTQRQLEAEAIAAIQRSEAAANQEATTLVPVPKDLLELLDAYGLQMSSELRAILRILSTRMLKARVSAEDYVNLLEELREYMEENL